MPIGGPVGLPAVPPGDGLGEREGLGLEVERPRDGEERPRWCPRPPRPRALPAPLGMFSGDSFDWTMPEGLAEVSPHLSSITNLNLDP